MSLYYGHMVRILHWCTDQRMTSTLETMELTSSQGRIMGFLSRQPEPPCPRDVEEAFQLRHPTVSGILSRLEQKGFIQLLSDPSDRRCKRIHILQKGHECHQTMLHTIQSNEEQMVRDFSPEEKALFADFLQRAIVNMGGSPCHFNPKEESKQ